MMIPSTPPLGIERGHRTLRVLGKGNKPAAIPLVPRTARTIDLAVGERSEGPILRRHDGQRLDRRTTHRWVRSIGKRGGLGGELRYGALVAGWGEARRNHDRAHANDVWIAAAALHIGAPLLTADDVFSNTPKLALHQ